MIKLLSISSVIPYDGVSHAGGKTYNSYIKSLAKDSEFEVSVLAFSRNKDKEKNDFDRYNIKNYTVISSGTILSNLSHFTYDFIGKYTDYGRLYSGFKKCMVMKKLQELKLCNSFPDIIELEWTDMALLAKEIKEKYPDVKVIASEHDVTFLGAYRRFQNAIDSNKHKLKMLYELTKQLELEALKYCDIVMPHNYKDADLLISNGIEKNKIFTIVPYFHDMKDIKRSRSNHDILFWGAMGRSENAEACRWFITNVMPLLSDTNIRFVIAGNNPPNDLLQQQSDRIIVTGYVEDETALFENSLCFVCPLLNGAGIKVKVLEAMSSGIPVITNDIGIEGIPGEDGLSYYRCDTPEQYAETIRNLVDCKKDVVSIEKNARKMIENNFDLNESLKNYKIMLKRI